MYSKRDIEKAILEAVKAVAGIEFLEKSANLVDRDMNIIPANFLYVFDMLEEKFRLPVYNIFIDSTYEVMTVENLTEALFELQKQNLEEKSPN